MNAIVGLTAIAGANIESQERVIECLSKITESSRHLLGLINEVLDMARIESGKMTLAQEDFNLSELVDNLITLTKPVLDEHKHNFDIHINHIEHEDVCGDSLRIQQVSTAPNVPYEVTAEDNSVHRVTNPRRLLRRLLCRTISVCITSWPV